MKGIPDDLIEELIFDCLAAADPHSELMQRTTDWPDDRRDRAKRALSAVMEQEHELATPQPVETPPATIAGYRVLRTLATGGMGIVYLAQQEEPIRRKVAIKLIRDGATANQIRQRFELERRALALMDHECIARIYDASTTDDGRPYLAMEFVSGQSITDYCDSVRLDTAGRLDLFEQVCLAVQHAHHRGIIHRDLKPSNILVAGNRERPIPKIIDFGLARPTNGRLIDVSIHTQHGALVGTPAYMSPEQAEESAADIDTRTDIYSLGVVLYELLTGALPLSEESLRGTPAEVQRRIIESDVPRPSTRVAESTPHSNDAATKRRVSPAALTRSLRGDLDWITLKAMERDRSRRYQTASEFATDIRRYLNDEPVSAGPPTLSYRLHKLFRRHRLAVVSAAIIASIVLIGAMVSTALYLNAQRNLEQFNLLRFRVELDDAIRVADDLHPPRPNKATELRTWLEDRAEPLRQARPIVAAALQRIAPDSDDSRQRFLANTMQQLAADLDTFLAADIGLVADVQRRLAWAETIYERSIDRFADRWQEARDSLKSAADSLPPIDLQPQVGLVPIGINPATALWEFYHLRSAADPDTIPSHRKDGSIAMDEGTGVVFVLVPGGKAWIGVQADDPAGPNYDRLARQDEGEGPPREVEMAPFFIARHELTQGQWQRLSGGELPSTYRVGLKPRGMTEQITALHPVETVSYLACVTLLSRFALQLPTEIQWAYACRGGAPWPWYPGATPADLAGHANLHDQTSAAAYPGWGPGAPFSDGFLYHAPVGSLQANPFGLFDVHGNVFEWCRMRPQLGRAYARGGAFSVQPEYARCGMRMHYDPAFANHLIGVRPIRLLEDLP